MILAVSILYSMTRCTTEFMMQSVEVRRWKLAQFDYKMTLIFSSITIPLLAVSGVSRSLKTIIVVLGIGLALALTFLAASFLMTMCFMPLRLFFWRKRREHPPVAVAAFEATSYGFLFSGLGILAIIAAGGSKLLFSSYEFFGLTEAPETLPVLIFIVTCMLFVLGCFYHHQFLLKVFAFEPEFNVKTFKQKDGSTLVHFERNDKKDKNS